MLWILSNEEVRKIDRRLSVLFNSGLDIIKDGAIEIRELLSDYGFSLSDLIEISERKPEKFRIDEKIKKISFLL